MAKPPVNLTQEFLQIDLGYLMNNLRQEDKATLAMYLLTDDRFLRAVIEQVVDGLAFDPQGLFWSASDSCMQRLREKLCEKLPEIEFEAVKRIIFARDIAIADAKRMNDWAWAMYHKWPDGYVRERPDHAAFVAPKFPSEEQVAEELRQAKETTP